MPGQHKPPPASSTGKAKSTAKRTSAKPRAATKPAARKPAAAPAERKSTGASEAVTRVGKAVARKPSGSRASASARKAKSATKSKHFSEARTRAERVLRDPEATEKLLGAAEKRTEGKRAGKLAKVAGELKAMLRLVKAYATGDYRAISWESLVLIVAGLVYLVSPVDVIPDVLPFGLADDATVILFVASMVHEELEAFVEWEEVHTDGGGGSNKH